MFGKESRSDHIPWSLNLKFGERGRTADDQIDTAIPQESEEDLHNKCGCLP